MMRYNMNRVKGEEATRLRLKKRAAARQFRWPEDGLPGSLALTHRRCGKATCHCAKEGDAGHPQWLLTFMVEGNKRVELVPADWVKEVEGRVAAGAAAKQALTDVLSANAELLGLERRARARKPEKKTKKK